VVAVSFDLKHQPHGLGLGGEKNTPVPFHLSGVLLYPVMKSA